MAFGEGIRVLWTLFLVTPQMSLKQISTTEIGVYLSLQYLALSNDVATNPGPIKYPCTVCKRSVENVKALQSNFCDDWTHRKCINMKVSD